MSEIEPRERIIVALDVPTLAEADAVVRRLAGRVGAFKVGMELLTAEGAPRVVRALHASDARLFFDGKFCDIPSTVTQATKAVAELGVWMFDVHASTGIDALAAAVLARGESLVAAVTVLSSMSDDECRRIFGASASLKATELARLAVRCAADAIVCPAVEVAVLKADPMLRDTLFVATGIRPEWAPRQDHQRCLTPAEAARSGADYLVIGRPILQPPSDIRTPEAAVDRIVDEIGDL